MVRSPVGLINIFFIFMQQECIPIGCVTPTSVAATRCQYMGISEYIKEGHLQPEGHNRRPPSTRRPVPGGNFSRRLLAYLSIYLPLITSCQYWWWEAEADSTERTLDQTGSDIRHPGRNMGPDRKWHHTPCEQNDWQTLVKTLPSRYYCCGW